jgi:hypothetical protein
VKRNDEIRRKYLYMLTQKKVWLTPDEKPVTNQSCIIFDWDDTILPTTFLNPGGLPDAVALPATVKQQLKKLESVANKILLKCMDVGKVFIITNAAEGWVEYSTKKYLPKLKNVVSQVSVISARTKFEEMFPNEYH